MFEHELDRHWKTVANTIRDGIMIVDEGGTIIYVNQAFEMITGYSKDEMIGRDCTVLDCDICEKNPPQRRPALVPSYSNSVK
jgi:two-component system response regulator HydG